MEKFSVRGDLDGCLPPSVNRRSSVESDTEIGVYAWHVEDIFKQSGSAPKDGNLPILTIIQGKLRDSQDLPAEHP